MEMESLLKAEPKPTRRWPRSGADANDPRPLRILVCDDEPHIVRLIQVNLQRQGYEVITAFDGVEGLEKIRAENPDICILDIVMPHLDGFEVLRRIRRDPELQSIFVIILTTAASDEDKAQGDRYGADMYMTKPFTPQSLVQTFDQ